MERSAPAEQLLHVVVLCFVVAGCLSCQGCVVHCSTMGTGMLGQGSPVPCTG